MGFLFLLLAHLFIHHRRVMLTNGLFRFSDKPHTNATATIVVVVVWWSPR